MRGGLPAEKMISIHPPREGRGIYRNRYGGRRLYFNPPSPCGEGRPAAAGVLPRTLFQSTLPVGGGTIRICKSAHLVGISIHPPPCGEGRRILFLSPSMMHFNPPSP